MKKLIALAVVAAMTITTAFAQDLIVESKQTFKSDDENAQQMMAMMGEMTTTMYVKGNMSKVVQKGGMTGTNTIIYDTEAKKGIMFMDNPMIGKKYMTLDEEKYEDVNEEGDDTKVTKTKDTKTILGYKCYKYEIKSEGGNAVVYATDELKAPNNAYGGEVTGLPLYTEVESTNMGMTMTIINEVTKVKKESISEKEFDMSIPTEYEGNEMDDLMGK